VILLDWFPVHKSHFWRGRSMFECTDYGPVQQPAKLQQSAEIIFSKYRYSLLQNRLRPISPKKIVGTDHLIRFWRWPVLALSPRPLRHSPRQASQLKLSGRYVILAVMPGVDYVSADEGIAPLSSIVLLST
jgi:hypothetical protein